MTEITKDEIIKTSHIGYEHFKLLQFICSFDVGDTLTLLINGVLMKEYTATQINCHVNMTIQDKGESKENIAILDSLRAQKEMLDAEIAKEEQEQLKQQEQEL